MHTNFIKIRQYNPLLSYCPFSQSLQWVNSSERGVVQVAPNLRRLSPSYNRTSLFRYPNMLLCFDARAIPMRLGSKLEAKFFTIWLSVLLSKGMAKCLSKCFVLHLRPNHWYTFDWRAPIGPLGHSISDKLSGKNRTSRLKSDGLKRWKSWKSKICKGSRSRQSGTWQGSHLLFGSVV